MSQWARDHDTKDDFRFGIVWKVFGVGGSVALALMAWSLKSQYDAQQQRITDMQATISAIHQSSDDTADKTARKLGLAPSAP